MVSLQLAGEVLAEVYAHAEAGYPEEVVGFLIGPGGEARCDEVRRCTNLQSTEKAAGIVGGRGAETAYELGPKDTLFLARSERAERQVKVIYHSHPDVGAYFSETDKKVALMGGDEPAYGWVSYLVIDVRQELDDLKRAAGVRALGAKLFRWDPDRADFVSVSEYRR